MSHFANLRRTGPLLLSAFLLLGCFVGCGAKAEVTNAGVDPKDTIRILPNTEDAGVILIDPGHGFRDEGCSPRYLGKMVEKDVTLLLAKELKRILQQAGYTVILSHDGEYNPGGKALLGQAMAAGIDPEDYIRSLLEQYSGKTEEDIETKVGAFTGDLLEDDRYSIYERCLFAEVQAKKEKVALFLSLHVNANPDSEDLSGFSLDVCGVNGPKKDSQALMTNLNHALRVIYPDTRMDTFEDNWDESFVVNKYVTVPSLLLECGYGTNAADAENLLDEQWRTQFLTTVAAGLTAYLHS